MLAYTEHLLLQGLAANTIRVYRGAVERAEQWLHATCGYGLDLASVTDLAVYAATLPISNSTRGQLRSALKLWYEHTGTPGAPHRAVRVPPQPELVCLALEDDEARAVVKVALGWWPQGTAVLFGLYLALRRTEIATAEWDRYSDGWYTVTGKGDRTATLPVHPVLAGELAVVPRSERWVFPCRHRPAPGRFGPRCVPPCRPGSPPHQPACAYRPVSSTTGCQRRTTCTSRRRRPGEDPFHGPPMPAEDGCNLTGVGAVQPRLPHEPVTGLHPFRDAAPRQQHPRFPAVVAYGTHGSLHGGERGHDGHAVTPSVSGISPPKRCCVRSRLRGSRSMPMLSRP